MSLEPGIYSISSKLNGLNIGRHSVEGRSLLPKRVITVPADVEAPKWKVQLLSNGLYGLSTLGGYAAEIYGKVFAILHDEPEVTKWTITLRENHGSNVYTIGAPSRNGWVVPEESPETQVTVRPLIATYTLPPQFPPNELFAFVRVDRD